MLGMGGGLGIVGIGGGFGMLGIGGGLGILGMGGGGGGALLCEGGEPPLVDDRGFVVSVTGDNKFVCGRDNFLGLATSIRQCGQENFWARKILSESALSSIRVVR